MAAMPGEARRSIRGLCPIPIGPRPAPSSPRSPRVLYVPAHALPARDTHRHGRGQLLPHLSTKRDRRLGAWAQANNVGIAYTPTNSSWLNRIEAQFTALRYFALDGTDHRTHRSRAA